MPGIQGRVKTKRRKRAIQVISFLRPQKFVFSSFDAQIRTVSRLVTAWRCLVRLNSVVSVGIQIPAFRPPMPNRTCNSKSRMLVLCEPYLLDLVIMSRLLPPKLTRLAYLLVKLTPRLPGFPASPDTLRRFLV